MKRLRSCHEIDNVFGAIRSCFVHVLCMFTRFARSLKYIYVLEITSMEARKVNQYGRSYNYRPGVAFAQDRKFVIIDSIISDGGDRITGYIPRSVTQIARELRVSVNTVKSVWFRYCEEMRTSARPIGGLTSEKLKEYDGELIDVLKLHTPSTPLYGIIEELEQLGGQQISMSALSRSIKSRLPSGHQYSRKNLQKWQWSDSPQITYFILSCLSITCLQKIQGAWNFSTKRE